MKCSVQNCSNNTKRTTKSHGITFHQFPKDPDLRTLWKESLGMINWELKERSIICSEHFRNEDFYETKNGLRRIKGGSIPVATQELANDLEAATRVCRVCLSMNVKMYNLKDFKLDQMLNDITGFTDENEQYLPQKICWECTARLLSVSRFKSMVTRSNNILQQLLLPNKHITIGDIKSVNRVQNGLNSRLIQKIFENDDHDLHISGRIVKQEKVTEIDVQEEREGDEDDFKFFVPLSEIKNEGSSDKMHFDGSVHSEDDGDDKALSEVSAEKPEQIKVTKRKIKKEKVVKVKRKKTSGNKPATKKCKVNESLFTITPLSYNQQIEEIQKRQESTSYTNALYKCTLCFKGFYVKDVYTTHMVKHSEQSGAYECSICKIRKKTKRFLKKHITDQHTEQYNCISCNFVTRYKRVTMEHEKWHAGTKYKCPHCDCEFDKITTYNGHIRIKHVSDFVCELCGYAFISKKGIDVHKSIKHGTVDKNISLDGPYCDDCKVKFVSQDAYDRHLKVSSKHTSDDDPNRLRNDSQIKNILRVGYSRHHVTCDQCGIGLSNRREYALHFKEVHPDKNPVQCYVQPRTTCVCDQCGKVFQGIAFLKNHMCLHTGNKMYKCTQCKKCFAARKNLMLHMRIHNNTRPSYQCPMCGKQFTFLGNMTRHMHLHSGVKPYKCDVCDKCFSTAGELKSHVDHIHLKKPWPKRMRQRPDRKSDA